MIYMHREIMQPPKGMIVDHKNRNKLDNTRDNLRNCHAPGERAQPRQDARHILPVPRRQLQQGVATSTMHRSTTRASSFFLGYFTDEIEAARAHDYKAVELFGEVARLNFPEEWPPERRREVYAQRDAAQKPVGATHASPVQGRAKGRKRQSQLPDAGPQRRRTSNGGRGRGTAKGRNKKSRGDAGTQGSRTKDGV